MEHEAMGGMSAKRLLLMGVLHLGLMYILMYAMVNTFSNVIPNLNNFYMAGLMTAAMLVLEALLMRQMYRNKPAINAILAASFVAAIAFFLFIRAQTAIGDQELIRSMIPHHAGAILMCEQASLEDAALRQLCGTIVVAQADEIAQMRMILEQLDQAK